MQKPEAVNQRASSANEYENIGDVIRLDNVHELNSVLKQSEMSKSEVCDRASSANAYETMGDVIRLANLYDELHSVGDEVHYENINPK